MSKLSQFRTLLILICSTFFLLASPLSADKPDKKGSHSNFDLSVSVSAGNRQDAHAELLHRSITQAPGL